MWDMRLYDARGARVHCIVRCQRTLPASVHLFTPPRGQILGGIMLSTCPSVRPSVCPSVRLSVHLSVTKLVNTIFWKKMNRFWCQLAQVVDGTRTWNDQLWGQEVKGQGQSHARTRPKIDWRLSGRIILDPLSPVVFLVPVCLKFKMADLRHLETREIAISQRKIIWFWWNLVHECRFGTRWQHVTKYENFLKFKMADGRCFKNRFFGHNSTADCPISVKFCVRKQFFSEGR